MNLQDNSLDASFQGVLSVPEKISSGCFPWSKIIRTRFRTLDTVEQKLLASKEEKKKKRKEWMSFFVILIGR